MAYGANKMGLGAFGAAALAAVLGGPLSAQTLWTPASDPVGIARAGAGVAFGQSLEAGALNPALLVTLRDDASAFVSAGMESMSSQATLQSNQLVLFSSDRNRFLPALGAAWKVTPSFYVGLKVDNPFMRHATFGQDYTGRFEGQGLELVARRVAFQGSYAFSPAFSVGFALGAVRVQYAFDNAVRLPVPADPGAPVSEANPAQGLLELNALQKGNKTMPSVELGFRWAINPRWTVAGAWQGPVKGTLGLSASIDGSRGRVTSISGFGDGDAVAVAAAPAILAAATAAPGQGEMTLPGRITLGVRQRVNQIFTWEADLRYVQGASTRIPGYPVVTGPSGSVTGSGMPGSFHSGFGISIAGEMTLTKTLTGRLGLSSDPGLRKDPTVEPLLGGSRNAAFSLGLGWKVLGGEASIGWQLRQAQDRDVRNLEGLWALGGYSTTGTLTRVEGMGHLWSVGFKKAF